MNLPVDIELTEFEITKLSKLFPQPRSRDVKDLPETLAESKKRAKMMVRKIVQDFIVSTPLVSPGNIDCRCAEPGQA